MQHAGVRAEAARVHEDGRLELGQRGVDGVERRGERVLHARARRVQALRRVCGQRGREWVRGRRRSCVFVACEGGEEDDLLRGELDFGAGRGLDGA